MSKKLSSVLFLLEFLWSQAILQFEVVDPCPGESGTYCAPIYECATLKAHFEAGSLSLDTLVNCGFTLTQEKICCPQEYPAVEEHWSSLVTQAPKKVWTAANVVSPRNPKNAWNFTNLVVLSYYSEINVDFEHRCTAVFITKKFLVTSRICTSEDPINQPQYAILGLKYLGDLYTAQKILKIHKIHPFNNDIVLLELQTALELEYVDVNILPICSAQENDGMFISSGWPSVAKSKTSSCTLYQLQLQPRSSQACSSIQNTQMVTDLDSNVAHRCFESFASEMWSADECKKCPILDSNVLHLQLPDESFCLAGISTPTSKDCQSATGSYFYTMLSAPSIASFIEYTTAPKWHNFRGH